MKKNYEVKFDWVKSEKIDKVGLVTLNHENCDYHINAFTKDIESWEENKDFEQDAKTPKRVIEIIKEHMFTDYPLFAKVDDLGKLFLEEEV